MPRKKVTQRLEIKGWKKKVQTVLIKRKLVRQHQYHTKQTSRLTAFVRRTKRTISCRFFKNLPRNSDSCVPGNLVEGYINKKLIRLQEDVNKPTTHGRGWQGLCLKCINLVARIFCWGDLKNLVLHLYYINFLPNQQRTHCFHLTHRNTYTEGLW